MKKIYVCDGIVWKGKISPAQVIKEQNEANILVHTEAFDLKSKKSTRLSVSTKIFEYLNAGKIVLGYGPMDVASMEFLDEVGVSVLCGEKENLLESIKSIIKNYDELSVIATEGTEYAKEHFDKRTVSKRFLNIVLNVWKNERK